jgi:steroid 5-alpha reductase family enzyme
MRHPNYAAEQAIWIVFYLFSVTATGEWINWSIVGSVLLVILFKGSSNFSEEISSKKYPKYSDYQKKVGRFLPKL